MNSEEIRGVISLFSVNSEFRGVYPSDKLPLNLSDGNHFFVVNLDNSTSSGSHWVGLFIYGTIAEYFDPLALNFTNKNIIFFLKHQNIKYCDFNTKRIQSYSSNSCGRFVILYLLCKIKKNFSITDFMSLFDGDNVAENELYIKSVFKFISKQR